LFHSTPISVSIFIFSKGKGEYNTNHRTRKNETLFIDATNTYKKVSSSEKRLTDEHLNLISSTIRKYRGDWDGDIDKEDYEYIKDFCSVVKSEEIKNKGYNYNPGRYVSYTEETDDTPLEVRLPELKGKLESKFKQSRKTEDKIISKLNNLVEHGDSDE
jgi:type I restriction enzyme M protein